MAMIWYERFCFLLIIIKVAVHHAQAFKPHGTDWLEADHATFALRITTCYTNSTNTTVVNEIDFLEKDIFMFLVDFQVESIMKNVFIKIKPEKKFI